MKNKFSIKANVFKSSRMSSFDGPWKSTVEEAVKAFAEKVAKNGLTAKSFFTTFVAERCDEATAPAKDGRGFAYKTNTESTKELLTLLPAAGVPNVRLPA